MPTTSEKKGFTAFCKNVTDTQIVNIYRKEKQAGREAYAQIAKEEAIRRGLMP